MNRSKQVMALPALVATALLSGCSGGSGETSASSSVLSSGVITQFGSVYVNGVRYDTSRARIIAADDGELLISNPTNEQMRQFLGLGQVVTVVGSSSDDGSNGVASEVLFDNQLVGPVAAGSVSNTEARFEVLGQLIAVTPETIIDDSMIERVLGSDALSEDVRFGEIEQVTGQAITLAQLLSDGMVVEVNGFPGDDGMEATRIEDVDNRDRRNHKSNDSVSGESEIEGVVTNLVAGQFDINGLTVLFDSSVLDAEDFATAPLAEGDYVEVKGTPLSATSLSASRIKLEDDLPGVEREDHQGRVEIEGVVSELRPDAEGSGGVVVINGIELRVDDISLFTTGLRIEIKGVLQGGVLLVTQIKDEDEDSVRIRDQAVSISTDRVETRLGVSITISDRTRIDDLGEGSWIEARGFPHDAGTLWTRIKFDDDLSNDCRLRGPVESITGSGANDFGMVIQGVSIDVNAISSLSGFKNAEEQAIGREQFFAQLDVGDVVQAESMSGGCAFQALTALEVEFKSVGHRGDEAGDDDANEIKGVVASVASSSFVLNGEEISVTTTTLIDDSLIETARNAEVDGDRQFGSLSETLAELLPLGLQVEVKVSRSADAVVALKIEDR